MERGVVFGLGLLSQDIFEELCLGFGFYCWRELFVLINELLVRKLYFELFVNQIIDLHNFFLSLLRSDNLLERRERERDIEGISLRKHLTQKSESNLCRVILQDSIEIYELIDVVLP